MMTKLQFTIHLTDGSWEVHENGLPVQPVRVFESEDGAKYWIDVQLEVERDRQSESRRERSGYRSLRGRI